MLQGPNLESIQEFAEAAQLPVIASGGVSHLVDIKNLIKRSTKNDYIFENVNSKLH